MPPVRSVKNQYRGINAHLHSFWQATHKWNRFHNVYATQLMQDLKPPLRKLGYTADIEESLQIRRIGDVPLRPQADVVIYDNDPHRPLSTSTSTRPQGLSVAELIEAEEDREHPYSAVVIRELLPDFQRGDAVAWIELLSPTNKGDTRDANIYLAKRKLLLQSGLVFVELDYLHETPPTFTKLGDYSNRKNRPLDAHPYRIVVLDPRPDMDSGPTAIKEFDVDIPLPTINIPLNADDALAFDFNATYQKVFEESFYGDDVDYTELPLNFGDYSETDQTQIARRMIAVLEAAKNGINLEAGNFPVNKDISLQNALARIKALTQS